MASSNSQGTKRPLVESPSTSNSGSSLAKKNKLELSFLHERFLDGKFSDFTVKAFGREWKLHKVILSGSPYFMSLFEKGWKESQDQVIQLQIPDQNVTAEAVDACFRSLYAYEAEFDEWNVVQILAAASFFQLDDVIQKSHEFIAKSIDEDTAMEQEHYNAISVYGGGKTIENAILAFLKNWITTISFGGQLSKISSDLMVKVVGSSDTFCLEEGSLYGTLVDWLHIKVTGSIFETNVNNGDRKIKTFDYFRQLEDSTPFLMTEDGKPYVEAFRQIRIKDLLFSNDYSVSELQEHKIFPEDWIKDATLQNQERERIKRGDGANVVFDINEQNFDEICTREGIWIEKFANTSEELTCVSTEIELSCEKSGTDRVFKIKRVLGDSEAEVKQNQEFWVRINLVVTDNKGRIQFSTSSGIKKVSLKIDETSQLLQIGEEYDDYEFSIGINYFEV